MFFESARPSVIKHLTLTLVGTSLVAHALTPESLKAASAGEVASSAKRGALISSELNGRELHFITDALDLRMTMSFLATEATQSKNKNLRQFGQEMAKTLPAQTAVLDTLAEMRKLPIPQQSARQRKLAEKIGKLQGAKQEKALLDALLDVNQEMVAAYEVGAKSQDLSIRQFAEQSLPYVRGSLARVQTMAGIAPRRIDPPAATAPLPPVAEGAARPGFRTNLPPIGAGE